MSYTLKQLKYFVIVVESGSISKAAEILHVSQPAVSFAINQLETQFDTQLLIRFKAKGISVTPSGQQLFGEAKQLLLHSEELANNISQFGRDISGKIGVGCYTTIAPFFIARLLRELKHSHPKLTVDIIENNLDHLQRGLFEGAYELALLYNINLDAKIEIKKLYHTDPYILVSKKHRLAKRKSISLRDVSDEPYIMLDLPNSRDYFRRVFSLNGIKPMIGYKSRSFELVRCLVAQQHGYSILNLRPSDNHTYDNGQVSCIEIKGDQEPLQIVLAKVLEFRLTKRAQLFSDFCSHYFDKL